MPRSGSNYDPNKQTRVCVFKSCNNNDNNYNRTDRISWLVLMEVARGPFLRVCMREVTAGHQMESENGYSIGLRSFSVISVMAGHGTDT